MNKIAIWIFLIAALPLEAQIRGVIQDQKGVPVEGILIQFIDHTSATHTDEKGHFELMQTEFQSNLIVSGVGYATDTISTVNQVNQLIKITLQADVTLHEVEVVSRKISMQQLRANLVNSQLISDTELLRAACCNLGESFVTNPSVDVSYSDAATGAKQIKLLGLSGSYVQMLTENIPNFRGAAAPYGLGYVPGPWMKSIQVSKGTSSVKNGYEAITGQINVEYKKPADSDLISANLYVNDANRYEANADASWIIKEGLSTQISLHYEDETTEEDHNKDLFLDKPLVKQGNFFNRWAYNKGKYRFQGGVNYVNEDRKSGQLSTQANRYQIDIQTERLSAFAKNALILDPTKNQSIALILSGSKHTQDSHYGDRIYDVDQKNGYASLLFETDLNRLHSLSTGLSFNYDSYDEQHLLNPKLDNTLQTPFYKEIITGGYAQYTFNLNNKWILMAGLRGDYSNQYRFFVTPRAHVKYVVSDFLHLRASAGKGFKNSRALAEQNFFLASSRTLTIDPNLKQEEAWNYGASASFYIPLFGKTMTVNAEYYYTNFQQQLIADVETNQHAVHFTNLDGKSFAENMQLEASYPLFKGFTLLGAYRITNVKTTYNGILLEKALTGKHKGLITTSYQTPLGKWQADATLQLNGGGRLPHFTDAGTPLWNERYAGFEQVSAQISRFFRKGSIYLGGENLTNYKQKSPIIEASNPFGTNFDATMVYAPVHGRMIYVGMRFNLERN